MKKHFGKLLTEVERAGSSARSKKWGGRVSADSDEVGGLQAWSRHRNQDYKTFGDVINPLRGFLRSSLGKHWDEVYSELSQLNFNTMTGRHLQSHLKLEVELETYLAVDGHVYKGPAPPLWSRRKHSGRERKPVTGFYVHPITGILCWREPVSWRTKLRKQRAERPKVRVQIGAMDCQLIDGIWYGVERVKLNPDDITGYKIVKIDGKWLSVRKYPQIEPSQIAEIRRADGSSLLKDGRVVNLRPMFRSETGPDELFTKKRQLGKKILKQIREKIKNDSKD